MIKKYISLSLLCVVILFTSNSCSLNQPFFGCERSTTTPSVPISTLLAYPEKINIEGKELVLYANLDKQTRACLGSGIGIEYREGSNVMRLPKEYKYEYLWFVNKNEVWETRSFKSSIIGVNDIETFAGPSWEPVENQPVYIIAKISDSKGKIYFIKAKIYEFNLNTIVMFPH